MCHAIPTGYADSFIKEKKTHLSSDIVFKNICYAKELCRYTYW
jgi:hypothetical protein